MDTGTKNYAKTLNIGHFETDKVPWRRLGQCGYPQRLSVFKRAFLTS